VQVAFAALAVSAGVVLTFALGPVSDAINQTTARVVGAALLALAVGALSAARDPAGNRTMLRVEIVFTALSALDLAYKLAIDEGGRPVAWLLLAGLVVGTVVLVALYPAAGERSDQWVSGQPPGDRASHG